MGPHDSGRRDSQVMPMPDADNQDLPGPLEPAASRATMSEFAGYIVSSLFSVRQSLESARSLVGNGPAGDRIAAVTDEVDQLINDVRTTAFSSAADSWAALRKQMARAARELQARALYTAAQLERRADLVGQPSRLDYPAEVKRWVALADQADRAARQWEQP
jgi:hypothetical protein